MLLHLSIVPKYRNNKEAVKLIDEQGVSIASLVLAAQTPPKFPLTGHSDNHEHHSKSNLAGCGHLNRLLSKYNYLDSSFTKLVNVLSTSNQTTQNKTIEILEGDHLEEFVIINQTEKSPKRVPHKQFFELTLSSIADPVSQFVDDYNELLRMNSKKLITYNLPLGQVVQQVQIEALADLLAKEHLDTLIALAPGKPIVLVSNTEEPDSYSLVGHVPNSTEDYIYPKLLRIFTDTFRQSFCK